MPAGGTCQAERLEEVQFEEACVERSEDGVVRAHRATWIERQEAGSNQGRCYTQHTEASFSPLTQGKGTTEWNSG